LFGRGLRKTEGPKTSQLSQRSPEKKHGGGDPEQAPHRVQFASFFDQFAALRAGI
jgi:hypothetical protein